MSDSSRPPRSPSRTICGLAARSIGAIGLVSILGALTLGQASAAPAGTPAFTIDSDSTEIEVGEEVTVEIAATELRDAYSYSLGLEYDSKVLRYIADSASTAVDGLLHVDPSGEAALGRLDARFSRLGTSSGIDEAATLLTARFLAVGSGSTSVTVAEAELVDSASNAWPGTDVATTAVLRVAAGAESPSGGGAPGGAPQPEAAPDRGEEASPLQRSETGPTKSPSEHEQGDGGSHAVDSDADATAADRSEAGRDALGSWIGWLIGLGAAALAIAIAAVTFRIFGARRATRATADPPHASIDEEQDRT